jgi:hypothetical protein
LYELFLFPMHHGRLAIGKAGKGASTVFVGGSRGWVAVGIRVSVGGGSAVLVAGGATVAVSVGGNGVPVGGGGCGEGGIKVSVGVGIKVSVGSGGGIVSVAADVAVGPRCVGWRRVADGSKPGCVGL